MILDIKAKNRLEADKKFEEIDLTACGCKNSTYRELNEVFEVDKHGVRKKGE